jgi:glucose/mannose transport system substrate-binding protein
MFNLTSGGFRRQNTQQAQARLASAILSAKGQIAFNTAKGSNPVRVDLPEGPFDVCTRGAMKNLQEADKNGGMVVPMVRIVSTATRQAILEIVERQFSGKMTSAEAVATIVSVVE